MEEPEKMVALQKAYADIILNTAKEAAARIMVSERKALRSQLDLSNTKEESLRMLVRLKQMIDYKKVEAQVTSSTQQRKIDELEAQLNEAEDVIADLRAELKWVRHKMEKLKDRQIQALDEQITKEETYSHYAVAVKPIIPPTCNSGPETITAPDIECTSLNQRISGISCCSASQQTEYLGIPQKDDREDHSSTIASIIMRSKKPEQYRDGCTQRNHPFERNLPDRKLSPLGDADRQDSVIKNEIEMNDQETGTCILTSPKSKPLGMEKNLFGEVTKKSIKFRKLRRIKSQFGKAKATIHKSHRSKPIKPRQVSSVISRRKTYIVSDIKSEVSTCSLPSADAGNVAISRSSTVYNILQRNSNFVEDESVLIFKRKDDMRAQGSEATASSLTSSLDLLVHPNQPSSVINFNPVFAFAIRGNTKYGEDKLKINESEAKMRPLPRLDPGLTFVRRGVNRVSGSKNGTVSVKTLNKSRIFKNEGYKELKRDSESLTQDVENSESSMVVCSKLRPEMFESPVKHSDAKDTKLLDTNESPNKFKYTFQRKRKKGSLKTDDGASPEKSVVKRRLAEKQNDAPEAQSSLIQESSKDRRQLAEVARQLISLAGRSW